MCNLSSNVLFSLVLFLVVTSFLLVSATTVGFIYMKNYREDIVKKMKSNFLILSIVLVAIMAIFYVTNVTVQGFSVLPSDVKFK